MCYLVLAIYRKLGVSLRGYIISAIIVAIISPFAKLLVSDNSAINWILDMTFGGKGETSFCFFPYLSYVFLGYVFGKILRRIPENEKVILQEERDNMRSDSRDMVCMLHDITSGH